MTMMYFNLSMVGNSPEDFYVNKDMIAAMHPDHSEPDQTVIETTYGKTFIVKGKCAHHVKRLENMNETAPDRPRGKHTFRFEQEAFMEQDFCADSFEEAREQAEEEWHRLFGGHGLFGTPNYMGVVTDEGEVVGGVEHG